MATEIQPDAAWSELDELEGDAQIAAMKERFEALASVQAAERDRQMQSMIVAEYTLGVERLPKFTINRLRAWMGIASENLEQAQLIAGAYDGAFERVPGEIAMRRATLVQTVARESFSGDDLDVLYELIPNLVGHLPRTSQDALNRAADVERAAAAEQRSTRKPWWKFW